MFIFIFLSFNGIEILFNEMKFNLFNIEIKKTQIDIINLLIKFDRFPFFAPERFLIYNYLCKHDEIRIINMIFKAHLGQKSQF